MTGRAKSQVAAEQVESSASYVVVGVLADGRDRRGAVVTMYRGSPVLPSVTQGSIEHLLSVGLIAAVEN